MKKLLLAYCFIFFAACITPLLLRAQTVPVGTVGIEDYYRKMQLLGKVDSSLSFSVRPLYNQALRADANLYHPDSATQSKNGRFYFFNQKAVFQLMPLSIQQQINSNHPYGWNDGPMIPAKGYQSMISGGFYLQYGPLSIQLRPDFVYAANPGFEGFATGHSNEDVNGYIAFHSQIDWPERFGANAYRRASIGASSVRLTFNPISVGLSNENVWWGPGISNALVLTNNSAGFKHITLNTVRPIKTFIGGFEGQMLAGRLENSGYQPLLIDRFSNGTLPYIRDVRDEWRYFVGYNINYQPKWLPGLFLGMIRTFNSYRSDIKKFGDYVPFLVPFQKKNSADGIGDLFPRDQITTFYGRWLFTKAHAEIYFEYGWEDNLYNFTDLVMSPNHSAAYIFGFRKMFPLKDQQNILFGAEITQTSQNSGPTIRETGLWYLNYQLLQGHTHQGQVLGAGTGPGGNQQLFNVSWVKGVKRIGFEFSRFEHDVDYLQIFFPPVNGKSRNWVDFAFSLQGEWSVKNFIFNAKLTHIKSLNYEWLLKNYQPTDYYVPNNTVYNLHAQLGTTFRF